MALDPRWTATMDAAVKDPDASLYDATIKTEIDGYNARFAMSPGYVKLEPKIFKAWIFTETGPKSAAWKTRPSQIGNKGDPAYAVLKAGDEHSDMIISRALRVGLDKASIDEPHFNVRAGLAYILTKASNVERNLSVVAPGDPQLHEYVVRKGDSLDLIRCREHTTTLDVQRSNPGIGSALRVGQKIMFHHASMERQIVGWRAIDPDFLKSRYNGGKDPDYANKVRYVMGKLP